MQPGKYLKASIAGLMLLGAAAVNAATTTTETWNPSAAGITNAGPFTFDNIVLNTFANIDLNSAGTSFAEQGFLRLSMFTLGGTPTSIPNAGFPGGSPYSLYISFSGTGTQSAGIPSFGQFSSLTYSLLGASGMTNFTPDASGVFTVSGNAPVTLATGTLSSPGAVAVTADPASGLLLPSAQVTASFVPNPAFANFFANPPASVIQQVTAAFTSTGTVVTTTPLGNGGTRFSLNGGGGNATLSATALPPTTPVPEPDTFGMLLAGLGLYGFIARRRNRRGAA